MRKNHERKAYTKYDYICIHTKIGVVAGISALVSMSLALLLGTLVAVTKSGRLDMSSLVTLIAFVFFLPMIAKNVKQYRNLQRKLREKGPDDIEDNPDFQMILPTQKQLWLFVVLLAVLAAVLLALCFLMLYLMAAYYETIFLIMFILCGTLLPPVVAVMVTYIRLLQIAGQL